MHELHVDYRTREDYLNLAVKCAARRISTVYSKGLFPPCHSAVFTFHCYKEKSIRKFHSVQAGTSKSLPFPFFRWNRTKFCFQWQCSTWNHVLDGMQILLGEGVVCGGGNANITVVTCYSPDSCLTWMKTLVPLLRRWCTTSDSVNSDFQRLMTSARMKCSKSTYSFFLVIIL